jgi:undecaprenyl-diphosphatase
MFEMLGDLDTQLFTLFNSTLTSRALDSLMPFITTQENWYPVLGGLWVAMLIWGGKRGRMAAVMLIIAVALADQVTCSILKPLIGRVRPCNALAPGQFQLLVGGSRAMSFPSAHAANSFAMAAVVSWRFRRLAPVFYLVAALVAYSRVYVGLHYPLDVIAGAFLGVILGRVAMGIVAAIVGWWERRREIRFEDAASRASGT